jgi:hypothetical protein
VNHVRRDCRYPNPYNSSHLSRGFHGTFDVVVRLRWLQRLEVFSLLSPLFYIFSLIYSVTFTILNLYSVTCRLVDLSPDALSNHLSAKQILAIWISSQTARFHIKDDFSPTEGTMHTAVKTSRRGRVGGPLWLFVPPDGDISRLICVCFGGLTGSCKGYYRAHVCFLLGFGWVYRRT